MRAVRAVGPARTPVAVAALITSAVLLLTGCGGEPGAAAADGGVVTVVPVDERAPGPELSGPTLDGGTFAAGELEGKVAVVNAWGSWCPPCREEADDLERVHAASKDEGVAFLGLTVKDNAAAARAFVERHGVSYPSVHEGDDLLLGFASSLPAQSPPVTWVLDREGRVAARVIGAVDETTLQGLVDDVLAEGP